MESEKVKEIKKALENCQKDNCLDCPYFIDEKKCRANDLLLDTITLINELESENERLKDEVKVRIGFIEDYQIVCDKKDKENAELKDRIAELEKENDEQYKRIMELEQDLVHADENVFYRECDVALQENKIKTEALKQFAERLKSKDCSVPIHKGFILIEDHAIDETLKEFMG